MYGEGPEAVPTVFYGSGSFQSQKSSFTGHTLASIIKENLSSLKFFILARSIALAVTFHMQLNHQQDVVLP